MMPSVNFQDDDPKTDKASSAGRSTGRKSKATGGINASFSEWHFDGFGADEGEQQCEVRFASVDDREDLPVGASAVAHPT